MSRVSRVIKTCNACHGTYIWSSGKRLAEGESNDPYFCQAPCHTLRNDEPRNDDGDCKRCGAHGCCNHDSCGACLKCIGMSQGDYL